MISRNWNKRSMGPISDVTLWPCSSSSAPSRSTWEFEHRSACQSRILAAGLWWRSLVRKHIWCIYRQEPTRRRLGSKSHQLSKQLCTRIKIRSEPKLRCLRVVQWRCILPCLDLFHRQRGQRRWVKPACQNLFTTVISWKVDPFLRTKQLQGFFWA